MRCLFKARSARGMLIYKDVGKSEMSNAETVGTVGLDTRLPGHVERDFRLGAAMHQLAGWSPVTPVCLSERPKRRLPCGAASALDAMSACGSQSAHVRSVYLTEVHWQEAARLPMPVLHQG